MPYLSNYRALESCFCQSWQPGAIEILSDPHQSNPSGLRACKHPGAVTPDHPVPKGTSDSRPLSGAWLASKLSAGKRAAGKRVKSMRHLFSIPLPGSPSRWPSPPSNRGQHVQIAPYITASKRVRLKKTEFSGRISAPAQKETTETRMRKSSHVRPSKSR